MSASTATERVRAVTRQGRVHAPGLAVAAVAVVVALGVSAPFTALSPIVVGVGLGILLGNLGVLPDPTAPGLKLAAKRLLRVGVVLLGFRLVFTDVLALGVEGLAIVLTVVVATFGFTLWLASRLRLSGNVGLLTATGFAICGASAVAAMREVVGADEDDTAYAIALVTLCGTLAIVALPLIAAAAGMSPDAFGRWVGASVHDVGQVVAAASTGGDVALEAAVVIKLTRVLLLGPLVLGAGLLLRRRGEAAETGSKQPLIPLFIVMFLAAAGLRTAGLVPEGWIDGIRLAESVMLTAALFGLGAGVQLAKLRIVGGRVLGLGLVAWAVVASIAAIGVAIAIGLT